MALIRIFVIAQALKAQLALCFTAAHQTVELLALGIYPPGQLIAGADQITGLGLAQQGG